MGVPFGAVLRMAADGRWYESYRGSVRIGETGRCLLIISARLALDPELAVELADEEAEDELADEETGT